MTAPESVTQAEHQKTQALKDEIIKLEAIEQQTIDQQEKVKDMMEGESSKTAYF